MPERRQIREAVVQFLYGFDLEGGADPSSLRDAFWQFVTESDRRALLIATWKTIQHLNLGRENRHVEFLKRLPVAQATLRARPDLERAANTLDRIAELEDDWTGQLTVLTRIPRDDHDDTIVARYEPALAKLFRIDRDLSRARQEFLRMMEDQPHLRPQLEPIAGPLRRLERISERMRMIEEPENFPDQSELERIRESRAELEALRQQSDALIDGVLSRKEALDERLEELIENFAPERIDPIDRAILRLGAYEILFDSDVPAPVAINEAIELAKRFGTSESGRFVNGVLDALAKSLKV